MARNGLFTGLDIGTSSIKVLVAEFIDGVMNVIGVSNVPSQGVKDGIIVDIEAAASAIRLAIEQAEEKAGIKVERVSVGLPANLLRIETTQGVGPTQNETKEIKEEHVDNAVRSALSKSLSPDREVITFVPEEFSVDGFQGIRDPRGMMGDRLEVRGRVYTGPVTMLHNLRKTVETAGLQVDQIVVSPLALTKSVLNEGEREFGSIVLDLGGGQTTVALMASQELQYTNIYAEGGNYISKDISKVFRTSLQSAETLKFNFGSVDTHDANQVPNIPVEVVGQTQPVEISELELTEVIEARVRQIFNKVKQDLERGRILEAPGGVTLTGGGAILPGITELAEQVFMTNVKLYVPNQVGIRNPMFAHVISLVEYVGNMSEVDLLAQKIVQQNDQLRRKPTEIPDTVQSARGYQTVQPSRTQTVTYQEPEVVYDSVEETGDYFEPEAAVSTPAPSQPKKKVGDRVRGIFGSLFD